MQIVKEEKLDEIYISENLKNEKNELESWNWKKKKKEDKVKVDSN